MEKVFNPIAYYHKNLNYQTTDRYTTAFCNNLDSKINNNMNNELNSFNSNNFYVNNTTNNADNKMTNNYFSNENFLHYNSYSFHNPGFTYLNSQLPYHNTHLHSLSTMISRNNHSSTAHCQAPQYATTSSRKRRFIDENTQAKKKFVTNNVSYPASSFCIPMDELSYKECFLQPSQSITAIGINSPIISTYSSDYSSPSNNPFLAHKNSTNNNIQESSVKPRRRKREINKVQRQAANLRERKRMNRLNTAFEELWKKMPEYSFGQFPSHLSRHIKFSRVFILKSAFTYIEHLTNQLKE